MDDDDGEEDNLMPATGGDAGGLRTPLLTGLEAPSVSVASMGAAEWGEDGVLRELMRPKSGMRSAFMNMANSIM
jgi:sodium-coupled neutral amino acid transporter 11